jgi:hypothetical protein
MERSRGKFVEECSQVEPPRLERCEASPRRPEPRRPVDDDGSHGNVDPGGQLEQALPHGQDLGATLVGRASVPRSSCISTHAAALSGTRNGWPQARAARAAQPPILLEFLDAVSANVVVVRNPGSVPEHPRIAFVRVDLRELRRSLQPARAKEDPRGSRPHSCRAARRTGREYAATPGGHDSARSRP